MSPVLCPRGSLKNLNVIAACLVLKDLLQQEGPAKVAEHP